MAKDTKPETQTVKGVDKCAVAELTREQLKAPLPDEVFIRVWNEAPSLARFCDLTKYSNSEATAKASQLRQRFRSIMVEIDDPTGAKDDQGYPIRVRVKKYPDGILKTFKAQRANIDALAEIGRQAAARVSNAA